MTTALPAPTSDAVGLTTHERRAAILRLVWRNWQEHGKPTRVRDMLLVTGWTTTSVVHHHLQLLVRAGWVKKVQLPYNSRQHVYTRGPRLGGLRGGWPCEGEAMTLLVDVV